MPDWRVESVLRETNAVTKPFASDAIAKEDVPAILLLGHNGSVVSAVEQTLREVSLHAIHAQSVSQAEAQLNETQPVLAVLWLEDFADAQSVLSALRARFPETWLAAILAGNSPGDETLLESVDACISSGPAMQPAIQRLAHLAAQWARMKEENEHLRNCRLQDRQTGLLNRAAFLDQMAIEFSRSRRTGEAFSLLAVRIPVLEESDDEQAVLEECLTRLRRLVRDTDYLGRLGANVLGILLPGTPEPGTAFVAEKIRKGLADGARLSEPPQLSCASSADPQVADPPAMLRKACNAWAEMIQPEAAHYLPWAAEYESYESSETQPHCVVAAGDAPLLALATSQLQSQQVRLVTVSSGSALPAQLAATPPALLILQDTLLTDDLAAQIHHYRDAAKQPFVLLMITENAGPAMDVLAPEAGDEWLHPQWVEAALPFKAIQMLGRLRLERQLRQSCARLHELERLSAENERLRKLGHVSATTSSNLYNVFSAVLGRLQMIRGQLSQDEDLRHLQNAERAALKGVRMVRNMRRFADLNDASRHEPLDLRQILNEALAITRNQWKEVLSSPDLSFGLDIDTPEALPMRGRANELREAICHLLDNAFEAMPTGGRLGISGAALDGHIVLRIADNGTGLEMERQSLVFQPFSSTPAVSPAAVGLNVAQSIFARHGGTLQLESHPGSGSTFIASFPRMQSGSGSSPAVSITPAAPLDVLVVDDDASIAEVLRDLIASCGHSVTTAIGGLNAQQMLRHKAFDLMITDLTMQDLHGWELARFCRETAPRTCIVVASGWMEELTRGKAEVDFTLVKPLTLDNLHEIFNEVLRRNAKQAH